MTGSGIFLTNFEVFGRDETLSRVFDISSQSQRNKILIIYAN